MNCSYHVKSPISLICIAPHKCQRKLCVECMHEHGVEVKQTIPINKFQDMAMKKLKDSDLEQTDQLNEQRMAFKVLLSQIEQMLMKIWNELSQSIQQVYDWIEKENQSFLNIINENTNLAESSYTELEKLVKIVEGKILIDWSASKNFYLMELDQTQNWWDQHIKDFIEKSNLGIQRIQSLVNEEEEEEEEFYLMKEDLFEIFTYIQDIDETFYKKILENLRREKCSDILEFLSKTKNQHCYESFINKQEKLNDVRKIIRKITNVLINIQDHKFSKDDYSSETYQNARQELIKKMKDNKGIIDFIKFLVLLTSIDDKFIQCGSNGLNLLVETKEVIRNQSFENIRIKNTSLIGGNFVRCNLAGSEFENVDISGVNLNGAQLFNCKWKKIKIQEQNKLDGHSDIVWSVCISPDGYTLASGSGNIKGGDDCSIRLWDVKTGQQKAKLDGHTSIVYSVCFSPDGNTLVSGSEDKSIRIWDVKTGQQKAKLDGHLKVVRSVCFTPDGNTIASGSGDKSIRLWDVKTGLQKAKIDGHTSCIFSVCFSPDGNTLVSGSEDKSIRIWDVKTGQQKAKLKFHTRNVYSVCLSPDGNTLVSGSDDKSICLWDIQTQQIAKLDGQTSYVTSVCFSPDGNTLASGGGDKSIRLWDVKTRQQKVKFDGHTSFVTSVCFSPDGNTLASGSGDKSIRLWDVKTGLQKDKLDGYDDCINSTYFPPNDNSLASGSDDNFTNLLDLAFKDIFGQFKTPVAQHNPFPNSHYSILVISQVITLEAKGTLIKQGEFTNDQGKDLRPLFKSKGSFFLEDFKQK